MKITIEACNEAPFTDLQDGSTNTKDEMTFKKNIFFLGAISSYITLENFQKFIPTLKNIYKLNKI